MSDSVELASAVMQIIGGLYAIFIAVAILGIQTIPTIGNVNSKSINQKFYNDVTVKIPRLQTMNLILAYLILVVEFSCGAYIYKSDPTLFLFALYLLFIVAIIYIIYTSYSFIDYLLLAVTGKYRDFNVRQFEWIKKYDIFKVFTLFASFFISVAAYPIISSNYATVNLFSAIVSFFIGLITYVISNFTFK
jgi:hypothetical protein